MKTVLSQKRFVYLLILVEVIVCILFCIFVRFDESLSPEGTWPNSSDERIQNQPTDDNYPLIIDVQSMLFIGFGFLMTFMKRFGYSAVSFTLLVASISVQVGILAFGFGRLIINKFNVAKIFISWTEVLEGGFAGAAVLISFGAVLGKSNPLQLLVMTCIETVLYTVNVLIGVHVFSAVDIGGSIFIHTFGAYFGLFVSVVDFKRTYKNPEVTNRQSSNIRSDLFSLLGTLILWIYWPSFNGALAHGSARQRATLTTYISLTGSTISTIILSMLFGGLKLNSVDIQNAVLAGGVAVGAVADLVIQPYGALLAGCLAGAISVFGYQYLQAILLMKFNLHDSCGINNLHGMPGLMASFLSVLVCSLATDEIYGKSLYILFPAMAPTLSMINGTNGTSSSVSGSVIGRTAGEQAVAQLATIGVTLALAAGGGALTGFLINIKRIFGRLSDDQLFEDAHFFNIPSDDTSSQNSEVGVIIIEPNEFGFQPTGSLPVSRKMSVYSNHNPVTTKTDAFQLSSESKSRSRRTCSYPADPKSNRRLSFVSLSYKNAFVSPKVSEAEMSNENLADEDVEIIHVNENQFI